MVQWVKHGHTADKGELEEPHLTFALSIYLKQKLHGHPPSGPTSSSWNNAHERRAVSRWEARDPFQRAEFLLRLGCLFWLICFLPLHRGRDELQARKGPSRTRRSAPRRGARPDLQLRLSPQALEEDRSSVYSAPPRPGQPGRTPSWFENPTSAPSSAAACGDTAYGHTCLVLEPSHIPAMVPGLHDPPHDSNGTRGSFLSVLSPAGEGTACPNTVLNLSGNNTW